MKVYDFRQLVVRDEDVSSDATERLLNRWGAEGYRLRAVTRIDLRGVRPGDPDALPAVLYTLERKQNAER
jgi:hypothetical protein